MGALVQRPTVIRRAGAGTIAEIAAIGRPASSSFPRGRGSSAHQRAGSPIAAALIRGADSDAPARWRAITALAADRGRLRAMAAASAAVAARDAAAQIVAECRRLLGRA
jgi:UDP-N-acetylglucosamine:LPS N-acetylglucosamine transferase